MRKLWIVLPVFVTASMASAAYGASLVVAPKTVVVTKPVIVTQVPVAVVPQTQVGVSVANFHGTAITAQKQSANVNATATFGSKPLVGGH